MTLEEGKDFFRCPSCRAVHFPDPDESGVRDLAEESGLPCPACRTPLHHAAAGGIRLERCPNCRGLLIDTESFLAIIETLGPQTPQSELPPRPIREEELARRIRCPRCNDDMDTHPYAGPGNIVIDNCPACHLNFLDPRELPQILQRTGARRSAL